MKKAQSNIKARIAGLVVTLCSAVFLAAAFVPAPAYAAPADVNEGGSSTVASKPQCGSGKNKVETSIDIGCRGEACHTSNPDGCSALVDAVFAIIRLLSAGVGIVIIGSTIFAGIQYTTANGDAGAVTKAKGRIRGNLVALAIFIFGYAILNYVIPAGFFN